MTENADGSVQDVDKVITSENNNYIDEENNTELHFAAAKGDVEEVTKKLKNRQKTDPENQLGWTPLMMAARNGYTEVVKILLDARADSTRTNHFGYSVFLMAVASGDLDLLRLLLAHLLCGGVSKQSMEKVLSPISVAVMFDHFHIVQYLIDQSFDMNAVTPVTGLTPYMFAGATDRRRMRQLLIMKGANSRSITDKLQDSSPVDDRATIIRPPLQLPNNNLDNGLHVAHKAQIVGPCMPMSISNNLLLVNQSQPQHQSASCSAVSSFPPQSSNVLVNIPGEEGRKTGGQFMVHPNNILPNNGMPVEAKQNGQMPCLQHMPQLVLFHPNCVGSQNVPSCRKSSNLDTPLIVSPQCTPISQNVGNEPVFFPHDFYPCQFFSPATNGTANISHNDLLNLRIFNSPVFSPALGPSFYSLN